MNFDPNLPRVRLLSLLVAAACGGLSLAAQADPTITLSASYALNGIAADGLTDSGANLGPATSFPTPTGSDFYLSKAAGGSSVFFHTYGFTGSPTYFGARASGDGLDFMATTTALYHTSFTNTSGSAMSLSFSFHVDAGEVGLYGTGTGSAELKLAVRRDGSVVSQGDTLITQDLAGTHCSETDVGTLGAWASCGSATSNSVFGSGGLFTVDMGIVAAGASINIDYDIASTVSGQYNGGAQSSGSCYGTGYPTANRGGETDVTIGNTPCVHYNGIARSGDPFNGNQPFNVADFGLDAQVAPLPEPGSLALLAAAGGALVMSRRRRR